MLYLLGGAARTGKTRIARAFLARTGIPYFSLDFLMMGFALGLPGSGVDPEADELFLAEQLWPVIRSMGRAMVEDEVDYLLEGVQLDPRRVAELCRELPGCVRACFTGLAGTSSRAKLEEIRRFGGKADDWMRGYSDERVLQEIERLRELSTRIRQACHEAGLPYVEASGDPASTAAAVMRHLTGLGGGSQEFVPPPPKP